jgi:hypothetical protein
MIYERASAVRLAIARIGILVICWLDTALDPFPALASLAQAWFTAHGPWLLVPNALLSALWHESSLWALKLATLAALSLALAGAPRPRLWAGISAGLLTLTYSFVRGFGHADHSQLQLLLVAFALPFLPAWDALAWRPEQPVRRDYRTAFVMLAVVFGFPYFCTGAARVAQEGFRMFAGHSMQHFIARETLALDDFDFTIGLSLLSPSAGVLLNLGFLGVTFAELASPWAYLSRRGAAAWLLLIVPFHLFAPLLMHVLFAHNLALIAVLYLWPLSWTQESAR